MQRELDLEELKRIDSGLDLISDINDLKPIYYRLENMAQQYGADSEIQALVAEVRQRLIARGQKLMDAASSPASTTAPQAAPPPPPPPPGTSFSGAFGAAQPLPTAAMPASVPEPAVPAASAPVPPSPPGINLKQAILLGGVIGLAAFAGIVFLVRGKKELKKEAPPPASLIAVQVRTRPSGASIRVNGEAKCTADCQLDLASGDYRIEAVLPGYQTALAPLTLIPGSTPPPLELNLEPLPQVLKLLTDLTQGRVVVDDQPPVALVDGDFTFDKLAPGKHTVRVESATSSATFVFDSAPGRAPEIVGAVNARNLLAVVVANYGGDGKVYANQPGLTVSVDGQPAQDVTPAGLELRALPAGYRELTLSDGKQSQKVLVDIGAAPTVTAFLKLDINAGNLVVLANEDGASVFIDGREQPRKITRGSLKLQGLAVRSYKVAVQKPGFQSSAEQTVVVKKGEDAKAEFKLVKIIPKFATLRIRGAQPGASITIGEEPAGSVGPDGSFTRDNIQPGERAVELKREGASRRVLVQFRAGETVELGPQEVALQKSPGRVRFVSTPPEARLTWRRADEPATAARPITGETTLPEGSYIVTGRAQGFAERSVPFQLAAGENKTVQVALTRDRPPPPVVKTFGMAEWENPDGWVQEGGQLSHRGGDHVLYKIVPTTGTFQFNLTLIRGRRLQWMLNWKDNRNYLLFQMDGRNFSRREVVNGRQNELNRVQHRLDTRTYSIQIEVTPASIVHSLFDGTNWNVLDSWTEPGRDFGAGRFGLFIPGRDQYGIANFRFVQK